MTSKFVRVMNKKGRCAQSPLEHRVEDEHSN
jgi:hypothetical protein